MAPEFEARREGVKRISISLPDHVYRQLDSLVDQRGFQSRSQAVSEMISSSLAEFHEGHGDEVMGGALTLFFSVARSAVRREITSLQSRHAGEIISSLQVQLENDHVMEILILQGPASRLQQIADEFITVKGVSTGKLALAPEVIPPIYTDPEGDYL